jgi:hypothetical protein
VTTLFDTVVERLTAEVASTRCTDLVQMLESRGLVVTNRASGNHRVYYNPALSRISHFKTANFDCGHGRNSEVKAQYVRNVLRVLRMYETEIRKTLGEEKNG